MLFCGKENQFCQMDELTFDYLLSSITIIGIIRRLADSITSFDQQSGGTLDAKSFTYIVQTHHFAINSVSIRTYRFILLFVVLNNRCQMMNSRLFSSSVSDSMTHALSQFRICTHRATTLISFVHRLTLRPCRRAIP